MLATLGHGRRGHGRRRVHAHAVSGRGRGRAVRRARCTNSAQRADVPVGALALVGMGATLAATTRSPLLAMIMIFEISLDYSLMPPLMLACVVSILVARQMHGESVYTEHLRVKGLALGRETSRPGAAMEQTVGDFMRAPVRAAARNRAAAGHRRPVPVQPEQLPAGGGRQEAAARRGGVAGLEGISATTRRNLTASSPTT